MVDEGFYSQTWHYWTTDSTASSSTTTWLNWNMADTTSTSTSNIIWGRWTDALSRSTTRQTYRTSPRVEQTPEERKKAEKAAAVRRRNRELAAKRAEELLLQNMTPQQLEMYRRLRRFQVRSKSGKLFEVDCDKRMHNIFELDSEGKRVKEYCIYQQGNLPMPDNHLAQKLLLEADEREFMRLANVTRLVLAG